jgi:hypothetical protein
VLSGEEVEKGWRTVFEVCGGRVGDSGER